MQCCSSTRPAGLPIRQKLPGGAHEKEAPQIAALRIELQAMRTRALRQRAAAAGASEQELDDADDSDAPKTVLIEIVIRKSMRKKQQNKDLENDADGGATAKTPSAKHKLLMPTPGDSASSGKKSSAERECLVTELRSMKMSLLKQRALDQGVEQTKLDEVDDSEDPREAVIAVLVALHESQTSASESDNSADRERLISELTPMKMSLLKQKALEQGAAQDQLDEVDDSDDPREAVIGLLLVLHENLQKLATKVDRRNELQAELRAELATLRVSELRRRAVAAGASQAELAEADDADTPKAALVEITISLEMGGGGTSAVGEQLSGGAVAAAAAATAAAAEAALRLELAKVKPSALRRRAIDAGASDEIMSEIEDADDPKAALVAFIVKAHTEKRPAVDTEAAAVAAAAAAVAVAADAEAALKSELAKLRPSALRRRAADVGASDDNIDEAEDADDPKAHLIDFIVRTQSKAALGVDTAAAGGAAAAAAEAEARREIALRAELASLKISALRRRVVDAGALDADMDDLLDADDPKVAMLDFIVNAPSAAASGAEAAPAAAGAAAEAAAATAAAAAEAEAALCAELASLKISALRRRAVDAGALDADMDDILDADDPKVAMMDFIVSAQSEAATAVKKMAAVDVVKPATKRPQRSHTGVVRQTSTDFESQSKLSISGANSSSVGRRSVDSGGAPKPLLLNGRHAMLSYQVRSRQVGPEVGPTSAFYSSIPTGMHGPTLYLLGQPNTLLASVGSPAACPKSTEISGRTRCQNVDGCGRWNAERHI
jgi:hypothetical protein